MPVVMKNIFITVCAFVTYEQLYQQTGHNWHSLVQAFTRKMFRI